MIEKCPKCGEEVEGEFLRNHVVPEYQCECGHYWIGDFAGKWTFTFIRSSGRTGHRAPTDVVQRCQIVIYAGKARLYGDPNLSVGAVGNHTHLLLVSGGMWGFDVHAQITDWIRSMVQPKTSKEGTPV